MSGIFSMYHPALQALGYAIFHSLWQGAVLFFPVQVLLYFYTKSAARYRILFSAFSILFVAFIATFLIEWEDAIAARAILQNRSLLSGQIFTGDYLNGAAHNTPWWQQLAGFHQSATFKKILPFISVSYAFGILLLGGRMLFMLLNIRRIKTNLIPVDENLHKRFVFLAALVPVRESVRLFLSEKVNVPVMLGYFRPIVVLPVALINQLDWQQTEAILLHELAHVRRKDYVFNIVQSIMEILMFFNPLVWWFSGAIRKEREHACDDIAVRHTTQPVKYAEALLQLEYARTRNFGPALAVTGNNRKYTLLTRIKRIVEMKTPTPKSAQSIFASATVVMIIAALVCFYAATAQEKDIKEPVAQTQTKTYSQTKATVAVKDKDGEVHTYSSESENNGEKMPDMDALVKTAMAGADSALEKIDWEQVSTTISTALQNVNWDEVGQSIKEAGEKIDWEEINKSISEARNAARDIDWDQISDEINQGIESQGHLDNKEIKKALNELKKALKKVEKESGKSGFNYSNDMKAAARNIMQGKEQAKQSKEAREMAVKMYNEALDNMKEERRKSMLAATKMRDEALSKVTELRNTNTQAAKEIRDRIINDLTRRREENMKLANKMRSDAAANAKMYRALTKTEDQYEALKLVDVNGVQINELLAQLEKDGLINRQKDFDISYKNNTLIINGKKISERNYKTYFDNARESETTISGGKNKLAIKQK